MNALSVVITAHNNQDQIAQTVNSAAFADEIIVIDNQSTDHTARLAKKAGARVIPHKNNPTNLNDSKNFGFTKARGPWILSLDSDERVEPDLKQEIELLLQHEHIPEDGFYLPRKNIIFGKWIEHGLWYPDHQLRLFKKGKGRFAAIHNHELLKVDGVAGKLKGHLTHFNYSTISQYTQKIDKQYSDNEVNVFLKKGGRIAWHDALRFPFQDFLTNYFLRGSYQDGLHGLVLSLLQAFYMFVVFAKIWERQGFKSTPVNLADTQKEFKYLARQLLYWYNHTQSINAPLAKKLFYKLQNKLL